MSPPKPLHPGEGAKVDKIIKQIESKGVGKGKNTIPDVAK